MSTESIPLTTQFAPLSDEEIKRRIEGCPKLASLGSINKALSELIRSESSLSSQIAQIIRRDPSLSARLLRMVNSVYFGLSTRINNIEEAVFFLGLRQIRELSMATPVLEELERFQVKTNAKLPWKDLWTHSIGTAILTREILGSGPMHVDDDTDYLVGLLSNVGKVIMAYAFPDELNRLITMKAHDPAGICALEREVIGWDHGQIGAYFLARHHVSEEIVTAIQYHASPEHAPNHQLFTASIQIADHLLRFKGINGGFEQIDPIEPDSWLNLSGWKLLYGTDTQESKLARASLANSLQRLPTVMQRMI
jgi:HD-like signal output (HDOD) protein